MSAKGVPTAGSISGSAPAERRTSGRAPKADSKAAVTASRRDGRGQGDVGRPPDAARPRPARRDEVDARAVPERLPDLGEVLVREHLVGAHVAVARREVRRGRRARARARGSGERGHARLEAPEQPDERPERERQAGREAARVGDEPRAGQAVREDVREAVDGFRRATRARGARSRTKRGRPPRPRGGGRPRGRSRGRRSLRRGGRRPTARPRRARRRRRPRRRPRPPRRRRRR